MLGIDFLEETALDAHAQMCSYASEAVFRKAVLILLIGIAERLDGIMEKG